MIRLTDKKLPAGLHQDVSQEMIHFVQAWPPLGRCGRIQRFLQSWAGAGARGITFPVPLSREMQHLKPKKSHCPETGTGHRVEWASLQQRCVQDGWPTLWTDLGNQLWYPDWWSESDAVTIRLSHAGWEGKSPRPAGWRQQMSYHGTLPHLALRWWFAFQSSFIQRKTVMKLLAYFWIEYFEV